ncbi:Phosphoribosylaminoimidazole-succinocarboxamide synthase [Arachis hypogaea]|nr:Phosphoribosylaminoimidazole-succinocarboxamide synthase [Arachis hypogaea]
MSESMFMAAALNPPKPPSKSSSHPLFCLPNLLRTHFQTNNNFPTLSAAAQPQQQEHAALLDTLRTAHARTKCSNPSEPHPLQLPLRTNLHHTVPALTSKTRGKVRDIYDSGEYLVLVTTDRQSAFDRILASIPFKGQNPAYNCYAVVSTPDPNVTIAKKCSVFPVEFVARGFVTGSTDTSLWTVYNKGIRNYCGNALPDGLVKNQKMAANILTPTTKAADHDVPVTLDEIIERGLMTRADYEEVSRKALSLFEYGQCVALEHGLILVDTKYEFGKAEDGSIMLIDEVHTPDSSRYWIANSYLERFQNGLEPENVDKEFLRLWFKNHCNPYEDEVLPEAPEDLICELSWRYIFLYETITKSKFEVLSSEEPIHERISRNVTSALASLK